MSRQLRLGLALAVFAALTGAGAASSAAVVSGPNGDPNKEGLAFGSNDAFDFGGWFFDDGRTIEGNNVGAMGMTGAQFAGAGMSIPVSNGENGNGGNAAGGGPAPSNPTAANPAFAAVGNASGRLENGNVVRLSAYLRNDPTNPVTVDPQIPPVLKLEFHTIALATGGTPTPQNVVLDTDVNLGLGTFAPSTALSTSAWTLFVHEYAVNDAQFTGGATVGSVEEIRPVIFVGDFSNNSPTSGAYLIDNVLVELFANQAAADGSPASLNNPPPVIPEPATTTLAGAAVLGCVALGRRKSAGMRK